MRQSPRQDAVGFSGKRQIEQADHMTRRLGRCSNITQAYWRAGTSSDSGWYESAGYA